MDVFGSLTQTIKVETSTSWSSWPRALSGQRQLKNVTTETIVNCLVDVTAFTRELLSDNSSNFVSKVMRKYCKLTDIKQIRTSPYHPQTDGIVERFNAILKRLLRKLMQDLL